MLLASLARAEAEAPIGPGLLLPGVFEPGLLEPGVLEPGESEPGLLEPGVFEPGSELPGLLEPGVLEPGLAPEPEPGVFLSSSQGSPLPVGLGSGPRELVKPVGWWCLEGP